METAWLNGLIGGSLIGSAAALYLLFNGRIAGMTGIVIDALTALGRGQPLISSVAFLLAAFGAAALYAFILGAPALSITHATAPLIISGLVVGVGVTLANGCTSGHGICGMARLSRRSLVATATFMASTAATVALLRHGLGITFG